MILDRILAVAGLIVTSPILAICAVAILFEDGAPVIFSQSRIGRGGHPFNLRKLRSMRMVPVTSSITAAGDPRITRIGKWLRRYKLDELPQLWNVAVGEMNLIGPRPEVSRFVDMEDPRWRQVLSVLPGITDLATLMYRNEEELLASSPTPEAYYRSVVLPEKLHLNVLYLKHRSLGSDLKLLFLTIRYAFWPVGFKPENIRHSFLS